MLNLGESCGARWTLALVLLVPLSANSWGFASLYAIAILTVTAVISSYTCNDLKCLSETLPPTKSVKGRRDRNLRSFCDFMAIWMMFLAHLVAVAICARILSATADHLTEGRLRQWLFGYETRSLGEPWPDVLGVTVVLVVCGLYMCGLEKNYVFTYLMLIVLCFYFQFITMFCIMNIDFHKLKYTAHCSFYQVFAAGASMSYTFCTTSNKDLTEFKRNKLLMIFIPTVVLNVVCFFHFSLSDGKEFDGVLPVMSLLHALSANWQSHIVAGLSVCCVGLAFTDLCPSLFAILVQLANSEWKILTRSLAYESTSTGSPVLAVFTAGSLSAILAFACPLSHMVSLLNASHLLSVIIQAIQYTVLRCVPTDEQKEQGGTEYKRLDTKGKESDSKIVKSKSHPWFVPSVLRHTKTLQSLKLNSERGKEERECLLLEEYSADMASQSGPSLEKTEAIVDEEKSSSDDSTDIDEVVKEYKDIMKVATTSPEVNSGQINVPSSRGSLCALIGVVAVVLGSALLATATCSNQFVLYYTSGGAAVFLIGLTLAAVQPAHYLKSWCLQPVEGQLTILFNCLFLTPLLIDSWPAIIVFIGAGGIIFARCDRCCGTFARSHVTRLIKYDPLIASSTFKNVDTLYVTS